MERVDLEEGELYGLVWLIAHNKLECEHTFPKKQNTKVTMENKKKLEINKKIK
jgi:hypothetical protein